jgi:hypothetical protein
MLEYARYDVLVMADSDATVTAGRSWRISGCFPCATPWSVGCGVEVFSQRA